MKNNEEIYEDFLNFIHTNIKSPKNIETKEKPSVPLVKENSESAPLLPHNPMLLSPWRLRSGELP